MEGYPVFYGATRVETFQFRINFHILAGIQFTDFHEGGIPYSIYDASINSLHDGIADNPGQMLE
jgi:hypothetical protein